MEHKRIAFSDFRFGLEVEHLRIDGRGNLSRSPHPTFLPGPDFTKDFAESQLEIVTEPFSDIGALERKLGELTAIAHAHLPDELLWPFSMPPAGLDPDDVALASFSGTMSEAGAERASLYRKGLALRYGTLRQLISGVHLNVSFGDRFAGYLEEAGAGEAAPEGELYIRIARSLYRRLWLLILLTGASPLSPDGRTSDRRVSFRNSPAGYGGQEYRAWLDLSDTAAYGGALKRGLATESAAWHALGLVRDGEPIQLSTNVFQSEKEFYAPIRLRTAVRSGEADALAEGRVDRLELRFLDLDPFSPEGIRGERIRLLHLFVLSAALEKAEGRSPGGTVLMLERADRVAGAPVDEVAAGLSGAYAAEFRDGLRILDALDPYASALDGNRGGAYRASLDAARAMLLSPENLPSVRLSRLLRDEGSSWNGIGLSRALAHRALLTATVAGGTRSPYQASSRLAGGRR